MKHKLVNPFPMEVSDKLINLLDHWFEWRHKQESPRSVHLPEETYRWRMENGHLVAEPGFCLEVSTAPRDPGRMWEFNLSFWDLDKLQQAYVYAMLEFQNEPWLRGKQWRDFFRLLNLKPRRYERLLLNTLRILSLSARRKRLL